MKSFSLRFFSDHIENQFSQQNMEINFKAFSRNLLFIASLGILISVYAFLHNIWQIGVFAAIFVLILPIVYFLGKRSPFKFDFCCFIVSLVLNLNAPTILFMHRNSDDPIADSQTYLIGYAVSSITQTFNLGSRFYLKVLPIFCNLFVLLFIKIHIMNEFTIFTMLFIGSNFLVLNYTYWQDRIQRQAFLTKNNELLWKTKIGTCAKISIITVVSKKGEIHLEFPKCNKTSRKKFQITDHDSLKNVINNFKMTQKKYFSTNMVQIMKSQQKSKFLSLHSYIQRFSEQTQVEASEFIGIHDSCLYDVQIFTTWNDDLLNIHTLITKSSIENENECRNIFEYERKLFTNFRNQFAKQIKTIFVKLQCMRQDHQEFLYNGSVISDVYNALRINYNLQLYLNPEYVLNKNDFLLGPLIEKINSVVCTSMPNPLKLNFQCNIDPCLTMFSCQKTLFQILFNMHSIIVRSAQQSGFIKILVQQRSTQLGSLIKIGIESNITTLSHIMDGQNYQLNKRDKNSKIQLDEKKVGIEILVSEYLICKIGPIKYIKMVENYQGNPLICFTLYQDLSILNCEIK